MRKILKSFLNIGATKAQPIKVLIKSNSNITQIQCEQGQNLMDATNKIVNKDINVYGLCDKQLACTTCSVEVQKFYDKLPQPSEQELDILYSISNYKEQSTRMACQIYIKKQLDGMIINIPKKSTSKQ